MLKDKYTFLRETLVIHTRVLPAQSIFSNISFLTERRMADKIKQEVFCSSSLFPMIWAGSQRHRPEYSENVSPQLISGNPVHGLGKASEQQ